MNLIVGHKTSAAECAKGENKDLTIRAGTETIPIVAHDSQRSGILDTRRIKSCLILVDQKNIHINSSKISKCFLMT